MANNRDFSFKFVGWASSVEDRVLALAICTCADGSIAIKTCVLRASADRASSRRATMLLRMSEAPASLALAGRRTVGSYRKVFTTNIDRCWEVVSFKRDLSEVGGILPTSSCRQGVARHCHSVIFFAEKVKEVFITGGPVTARGASGRRDSDCTDTCVQVSISMHWEWF